MRRLASGRLVALSPLAPGPGPGSGLGLALGLALGLLLAPRLGAEVPTLAEGDRLFRQGKLEEAIAAYAAAYREHPDDPLLAYNLGTAAHDLGRLPEALLWYRRAELGMPGDPWLEDNLTLARSQMNAPAPAAAGAAAALAAQATGLETAGALVSWVALALLLSGRVRLGWVLALAIAGAASFAAGGLAHAFGPRPAVVLAACAGGGGLPAGSEVWATRRGRDWAPVGALPGVSCPPGTVVPVEP